MPTKEQYRKNPAKYRTATQKWRARNRKKHRNYTRQWYRKNHKRALDYMRKARQTRKYQARMRKYRKQWYRENRNKVIRKSARWAKRNRERRRQIGRNWAHSTYGRTNVQKNTAKRRARIRTNGGTLTAKQWRNKLKRYGHRCARCRRSRKIELHHIKPLADGGKNTIRNVLPLCGPCHKRTHRELKKAARKVAMRAPASLP